MEFPVRGFQAGESAFATSADIRRVPDSEQMQSVRSRIGATEDLREEMPRDKKDAIFC